VSSSITLLEAALSVR